MKEDLCHGHLLSCVCIVYSHQHRYQYGTIPSYRDFDQETGGRRAITAYLGVQTDRVVNIIIPWSHHNHHFIRNYLASHKYLLSSDVTLSSEYTNTPASSQQPQ